MTHEALDKLVREHGTREACEELEALIREAYATPRFMYFGWVDGRRMKPLEAPSTFGHDNAALVFFCRSVEAGETRATDMLGTLRGPHDVTVRVCDSEGVLIERKIGLVNR